MVKPSRTVGNGTAAAIRPWQILNRFKRKAMQNRRPILVFNHSVLLNGYVCIADDDANPYSTSTVTSGMMNNSIAVGSVRDDHIPLLPKPAQKLSKIVLSLITPNPHKSKLHL